MKLAKSILRLFLVFCFAMRRDKYLKPKPFLTAVLMATVLAILPIRYWADAPENGPENWGARVQLTFLFPK